MSAPRPVLCDVGRRLLGDADQCLKKSDVGLASGLMLINLWGSHTKGCKTCTVGPSDLVTRGIRKLGIEL